MTDNPTGQDSGLKTVPRDPTIEMLVAGRKQTFADMTGEHMGPSAENTWKAMFDAAMSQASPPPQTFPSAATKRMAKTLGCEFVERTPLSDEVETLARRVNSRPDLKDDELFCVPMGCLRAALTACRPLSDEVCLANRLIAERLCDLKAELSKRRKERHVGSITFLTAAIGELTALQNALTSCRMGKSDGRQSDSP